MLQKYPKDVYSQDNIVFHDSRVCNNTDSCSIVGDELAVYLSSKVQICACDEQCSIYDDCCEDSNFTVNHQDVQKEYTCVATTFHGSVYMKTSCPPSTNYTTVIRENCESPNETLLRVDVLLSTPVTNTKKRVTYRNLFCALCHDEDDFEFWNIGFTSELFTNKGNNVIESSTSTSINISSSLFSTHDNVFDESRVQKILENLTINDTDDAFWFWTSSFDHLSYKCWMNATLPKPLTEYVRFCELNVEHSCIADRSHSTAKCIGSFSYVYFKNSVHKSPSCVACNSTNNTDFCHLSIQSLQPTAELRFQDERIPKVNRSSEIPRNHPSHALLYGNANSINSSGMRIFNRCFIFRRPDTGEACLVAKYFPNSDIELRNNKTTAYFKPYRMEFPPEEWDTDIERPNETFICGTRTLLTSASEGILETVDDVLTSVLAKISILCLFLHLLVYQQLPEARNLPSKNLAALSATVLLAYLCFEIGPLLPSCTVSAVILHYALLSCFTWTLVMSFDCWYSLYLDTTRLRIPTSRRRTKFLIYCIISWSAPLLLIGLSLYMEWSPPDKVPCSLKPNYGESTDCFIFGETAHFLLFILPASIMFLGNIAFFSHTVYSISCLQRERKTVNPLTRHNFQLYTKLALLMGLTWTLGTVEYFTEGMEHFGEGSIVRIVICLLFSALNMSHGILFYVLFTLKKTDEIKALLKKRDGNRLVRMILSVSMKVDTDIVSDVSRLRSSKSTGVCEMVSV